MFKPGDVVEVKHLPFLFTEQGSYGYVRRTKPINGDDVIVHLLSGKYIDHDFSYKWSSLKPFIG